MDIQREKVQGFVCNGSGVSRFEEDGGVRIYGTGPPL